MAKKASKAAEKRKTAAKRDLKARGGKAAGGKVKPAKPGAGKKPAAKAAPGAAKDRGSKPSRMLIIHAAKKQQASALRSADRDILRKVLLSLRERLTGNITSLGQDSLMRHDSSNSEEDGTDAFERQLALGLVNNEHERIMAIDDALRRLDEGSYGICESCSGRIEVPRLRALPFVRMCISCQSEKEKAAGRVRAVAAVSGE